MISFVLAAVCFIILLHQCYHYLFDKPKNFPQGDRDCTVKLFFNFRRNINFSPVYIYSNLSFLECAGPPRVPFLGGYIFMLILNHKHLHRAVEWLCQFYKTSILGMFLSDFHAILITDVENTKKALNHRDFDGRPDFLAIKLRHPNFDPDHGLSTLFNLESDWTNYYLHFILIMTQNTGVFFRDGPSWHEQRRFTLRYLRDFGFGRRFDAFEKEIEIQISQLIDIVKNGPKYEYEFVRVILKSFIFQMSTCSLL